MKTIHELDFQNIVQIDRYLSGTMSEEEKQVFQMNLASNAELREDFRMVLDTYTKKGSLPAAYASDDQPLPLQSLRLSRKSVVARDLVDFGLLALLATFTLAIICLVTVSFLG